MNRKKMFELVFMSTVALLIIPLVVVLFQETELRKEVAFSIILTVVIVIEIIFLVFVRKINVNSEFEEINKLVEYTKKRKEIEIEIEKLTYQLMNSEISEFIDVNRLVFDGQRESNNENAINYDNFIEQFGIQKDKIKIKRNMALFLTPFNMEGDKLFFECQRILSGVNVFLQKTDNLVEKDDILMNIVSMIVQSEFIIVNINGRNPNVYYELGIAHALGKQTILLSKTNNDLEEVGFDIRQKKIIMYKNMADLELQLLYQFNRIKQ